VDGCRVRAAQHSDLEPCNQVCRQVHGHDRSGELADALKEGAARVVERGGRITGYTTGMAFFGHSVAESNLDMQALIAAADGFGGPGILVPTRNAALFRWCIHAGLRVVQPMTLMSMGLYNEPKGAWLPSITFEASYADRPFSRLRGARAFPGDRNPSRRSAPGVSQASGH
jgi:hypothetical protein